MHLACSKIDKVTWSSCIEIPHRQKFWFFAHDGMERSLIALIDKCQKGLDVGNEFLVLFQFEGTWDPQNATFLLRERNQASVLQH